MPTPTGWWLLTDRVGATAPAHGHGLDTFATLRTARSGEALRGIDWAATGTGRR